MCMRRFVIGLCSIILFTACSGSGKDVKFTEDLAAKEMLQGIWLDDDMEMPIMRIEGDTIYYADPQNAPVAFNVIQDTLYIYGNETVTYKIDKQSEYSFWFHSLADEIVKLHKSENAEDALAFSNREVEVIPGTPEVIKKDSVIVYKGTRYRGYVYINPSKMKVTKTSYSENGYSVDNVYFDNVIHICVYEGKKMLYGQDITKQMFEHVFPVNVLSQTILADMNFVGVDSQGYHYQAILGIPESYVSNLVNMTISFDNKLSIKKAE